MTFLGILKSTGGIHTMSEITPFIFFIMNNRLTSKALFSKGAVLRRFLPLEQIWLPVGLV